MAPGTEFARDFCARIGPLQLGVMLVAYIFAFYEHYVFVPVVTGYISAYFLGTHINCFGEKKNKKIAMSQQHGKNVASQNAGGRKMSISYVLSSLIC